MRMLTHPLKDADKEKTLREVEEAIEEMETIVVDAVRNFYSATGLEIDDILLRTDYESSKKLKRFRVVADVPASWERPGKEKHHGQG